MQNGFRWAEMNAEQRERWVADVILQHRRQLMMDLAMRRGVGLDLAWEGWRRLEPT